MIANPNIGRLHAGSLSEAAIGLSGTRLSQDEAVWVGDGFVHDKRVATLWASEKDGLYALVEPGSGGAPTKIAGARIRNALCPSEMGPTLLLKLLKSSVKTWDIALSESHDAATLWPKLKAASTGQYQYTAATTLNPFAGGDMKSAARLLESKGYKLRFTDPKTGSQSWVHPRTERRAYIDSGIHNGVQEEPPHVDMSYKWAHNSGRDAGLQHRGRDVLKKKFFFDPTDPDAVKMIKQAQKYYEASERLCNRDPKSQPLLPTMQKGGVEFPLVPLKEMELAPRMKIGFPAPPKECGIGAQEINQIIRELFVGIYLCNQMPSLSMDPCLDGGVSVSMPPAFRGTLVGDVLKEVDAMGKGILMGLLFPEAARRKFNETWRDELKVDPVSGEQNTYVGAQAGQQMLDRWLKAGAIDLRNHARYGSLLTSCARVWEEFTASFGTPNAVYTFVPRQKGFQQVGSTVLVDNTLCVGGSVETAEASLKEAHDWIAEQIEAVMLDLPEARRCVELLKMIGFMTQFLCTAQQENLMPDLAALPAVRVGYEPEDSMPPWVDRTAAGQVTELHGGIDLDALKTVPRLPVDRALAAQLARGITKTTGEVVTLGRDYQMVDIPLVEFRPDIRYPAWLFACQDSYSAESADGSDDASDLHGVVAAHVRTRAMRTDDIGPLLGIAGRHRSMELVKSIWDSAVYRFGTEEAAALFEEGCATLVSDEEDIGDGALPNTPLDIAISTGNTAVVNFMLEHGADPCTRSVSTGLFPLVRAQMTGNQSIVDALIRAGATRVSCRDCPEAFFGASRMGDTDAIRAYLQEDANWAFTVDRHDVTAMIHAVRGGHFQLALAMLEQNYLPEGRSNFYLHTKTPYFLSELASRAQPGEPYAENLYKAVLARRCVIRHVDATGRTLWHHIAARGLKEFADALWIADATSLCAALCVSDERGATVLGLAAAHGKIEILERLVAVGCSLDILGNTKTKQNVYEVALAHGQSEAAAWLLAKAPSLAPSQASAAKSVAAVEQACERHAQALVKMLGNQTCGVLQQEGGGTPLRLAVRSGDYALAAALLKLGAGLRAPWESEAEGTRTRGAWGWTDGAMYDLLVAHGVLNTY